MARLTLNLHVTERDALFRLALHERRDPRAQAELIIRRELENVGLLPPAEHLTPPAREQPTREVAT